MKITYREYNPKPETLRVIEHANAILKKNKPRRLPIRVLRCALFVIDAAFVDPFRARSIYQKPPLQMTWADFWRL